MAVTQKEIAARLGVSQTLVGVALSGKGRIGAELKAQIVGEAQRLGYKPNRLARALQSGRSQLVALWLPRPLGDFDAQILEALQEHAARDGFHLLTALSPRFGEVGEVLDELPVNDWPLDGVLALDSSPRLSRAIALLAEVRPDLPLVSFGHRALLQSPSWDAVGLDLFGAAQDAMNYLVQSGCKDLIFMAAQSQFGEEEPRLRAFRAACRERGQQGWELGVPDCTTLRRVAQTEFEKYLSSGEKLNFPLGVLAGNDDVALGILRALRYAQIPVPAQAKIIGCDDIADAADADPPLSTLALPLENLVETAWTLFKARLDKREAPPRQIMLRAKLVLRDST